MSDMPSPNRPPAGVIRGPSALDALKAGGAPMAGPAAVPSVPNEVGVGFGQANASHLLDENDLDVGTPTRTPTGGPGNTASTTTPHHGEVTGPATKGAQGTIVGQTKARPRTPWVMPK